jgi:hypothetical protein
MTWRQQAVAPSIGCYTFAKKIKFDLSSLAVNVKRKT